MHLFSIYFRITFALPFRITFALHLHSFFAVMPVILADTLIHVCLFASDQIDHEMVGVITRIGSGKPLFIGS